MVSTFFKDPKCAVWFEYLGLVVFSYTVLKLAYRLLNNFATFHMGFGKVNLKKFGSWAVVTGSTDGIGKAYTEAFAKKGLNIVLISRTLSKLEDQAKELEEKYSIHTKVIAADFTEQASIYSDIKKQIVDLDISVLINNVGMGYLYPDYLDNVLINEKFTDNMINCNIISVTKMTGFVLPGMIKRKGGFIVNVSSASGRIPTPLLTVYSATKAYVDFFSRSAHLEYKSKGITVQSLCPYFVSTKLSGMRKSLMAPKPDAYVASALNTLGCQPVSNGYSWHNLQGWILENVFPRTLVDHLMFKTLIATRSKGIAKQKRLAEQAKKE